MQLDTMSSITSPPAVVSMSPVRSWASEKGCVPLPYTPTTKCGAAQNKVTYSARVICSSSRSQPHSAQFGNLCIRGVLLLRAPQQSWTRLLMG